MRIRDQGRVLEVDDVPVVHWLFGLLFVTVGSVFFLGPLGLFTDADRIHWLLRVAIAAIGALAVGVGVWQLLGAPRSRLVVDRDRRHVRLERVGLHGRTSFACDAESIASIELLERKDDEGNPIFQLRLFLRDAEPIVVSPVWAHGRERFEVVAKTLSTTLGVQTVNVRTG